MCNVKDFDSLKLLPEHRTYVESELEVWHRKYLPVGKNVIDIGAGCGETAFFYLNHGAEKILCVESNPDAFRLLCDNFRGDSRVIPILLRIDSAKIDIEGAEEGMVVETHFPTRWAVIHRFLGAELYKLRRTHFPFSFFRVYQWRAHSADRAHRWKVQFAHKIRIVLNKLS